ncbi:MAG: hypothetical protein RL701_6998 [Pseudomonadota bacterium]|jgi:enoyl-[acyl-carrier-protein] reductase (NADH)
MKEEGWFCKSRTCENIVIIGSVEWLGRELASRLNLGRKQLVARTIPPAGGAPINMQEFETVRRQLKQIIGSSGKLIDAVVCCVAGVDERHFDALDFADFRASFECHVLPQVNVALAACEQIKKSGVITLTSGPSQTHTDLGVLQAFTNRALEAFVKATAMAKKADEICINIVQAPLPANQPDAATVDKIVKTYIEAITVTPTGEPVGVS